MTSKERASALFDTIADCPECPIRTACDRLADIDCIDKLVMFVEGRLEGDNVEIAYDVNGERYLILRDYPHKPEGGGGGRVIPMGK